MNYDELIQRPKKYRKTGSPVNNLRDTTLSMFFVPDDFKTEEFGKILMSVGKEMMKSSKSNYRTIRNKEKYFKWVFGLDEPKPEEKKPKSKKHQLKQSQPKKV